MAVTDLYSMLGIRKFSNNQEKIRKAYLEQIRFFHPDAGNVTPEIAHQKTQELNHAYEVLRDESRKREYDRLLQKQVQEEYARQQQSQTSQRQQRYDGQNSYENCQSKTNKSDDSFVFIKRKRKEMWRADLIVVLIIALGIGLMLLDDWRTAKRENNDATASTKIVQEDRPQASHAVMPHNGYIRIPVDGAYADGGVLTVKASAAEHFYVKLRDVSTNEIVLAFFVQKGKEVKVTVPFGEYTFTYASGEIWYGFGELFGEETSYCKADHTYLFEDNGDSVTWWTVELYEQYDGNLETVDIKPEDF